MDSNQNRYHTILERKERPAAMRLGLQREPSRGASTRNDGLFSTGTDSVSKDLMGGSGLNAAYNRNIPVKGYDYSSNAMPPILNKRTESYPNYPSDTYQNKYSNEDILTRDIARKNALQSPHLKNVKTGPTIERNPNRERTTFSEAYNQYGGGASISINDRGHSPFEGYNPPPSRPSGDAAKFMHIGAQIRPNGYIVNKKEQNDYMPLGKSSLLPLSDESPYKASKTLGENTSSTYNYNRLIDRLRGGSSTIAAAEINHSTHDKDLDDGTRYNYSIVEKPAARDSVPSTQLDLENKPFKSSTLSNTLMKPDVYHRKPLLNLAFKSQSQGMADTNTNYPPSIHETKSSILTGSKFTDSPVKNFDYTSSNERRPTAQGSSSTHIEWSPSEPKGLIGLRNIGNTCFMNSILQSVMNAPKFFEYFLDGTNLREINQKNDKGIAKAFGDLIKTTKEHIGTPAITGASIHMLKRKIGEANLMFCDYEQHDAQEFLKTLLEAINEDLNRVTTKQLYRELKADPDRQLQTISEEWFEYMRGRDDSIVTDLFTGQLLSKTVCSSCGFKSLAFDNFWDLSVSFTKSTFMTSKCDLMKMINQFLTEETLEEMMNCEKCKQKRKFKKSFSIWRLPKILVIHLKRFNYDKNNKKKITSGIKYPVKNLDLTEFVKESNDRSVKDAKYSLFGVVNHTGTLNGGHYTADCLNPYNRKWYNYNDAFVKESTTITEKSNDAEGESPYMLFYVKSSLL